MATALIMALVNRDEVARVAQLDKLGLRALAQPIMDILGISDINNVYQNLAELEGLEFIDAVLEEYSVKFDYYPEELRRIPKEGPFITISNHPLGGIDGFLLIKLVSMVRPDFKVMVHDILQKVEPLKEHFTAVNSLENKGQKYSISGLKDSIAFVKEGHGLGVFPAGQVSTYQFDQKRISDKTWDSTVLRMIQKMEVPVVPIYFKARNSAFFYLLSLLHPQFRSAKLPSELRSQKNKAIRLRIGKAIYVKEQKLYPELQHYAEFLRQRTYLLRQALSPAKKLFPRKRPATPQAIIPPVDARKISSEIELLRNKGHRLVEQRHYEVFLAQSAQIPFLLSEIGRLREITFRAVGEGSNSPLDLDTYDYHYHHLLLWDAEAKQLIGAYRLGIGSQIFQRFGISGFYVSSLFKIHKRLEPMLSQSLEMGRAFVVESEQGKALPLFLLWKGIFAVVAAHPELRYITGCASISNRYSRFSQSLMTEFLLKNFGDPALAELIKPREAFKAKLPAKYCEMVAQSCPEDLQKFDRLIDDAEPGGLRIPVLIKKYLQQNARVVAFNTDPLFNYSLDGFMYIAIENLQPEL